MDRNELRSESGRVMITLTLVEDIAVVVLTIVLPGLSPSGNAGFFHVVWKVGQAVLLLVPVVFAGWKIIPRMLDRARKTQSEEIDVLLVLTICLVTATVTEMVGLSLALGAFVAGLLLGSSNYAHKLAEKVFPLRDAFVAIFFVTVGMLIDPRSLFSNWQLLAVLTGLILVGKFVVWFLIVRLFRYPASTAFRVGVGLTQIGEFSFVLARIALDSHLITREVYNAILAASLVTILVNATLFKLVKAAPSPMTEPDSDATVVA